MKPVKPLTDTKAKAAKPKDKTYKLADGGGLYLEVMLSGAKVWRLKYLHPTKRNDRGKRTENRLTIGKYPKVSIRDARKASIEAKELMEQGIDPNTQKKREKLQRASEFENSFEVLAREWHKKNLNRWKPNHAARVLRSLEIDVFRFIGDMPITDIGATDVLAVLRRKESDGALHYVAKLRQRIGAVFRYAVATGKVRYNPVPDLIGATEVHKSTPRRALSLTDLPAFLNDLDNYNSQILKRALRFTLLTFVRTAEVRGGRWSEIDWQAKEWHIPGERMKMGEPHIVPLSDQALALLEGLKPLTSDSEYLFYTRRRKDPMSENAMLQAVRRLGWKDKTTVHGFRATASTILNESGFRPDVIERQLAHSEQNKVRAAYHRSEYMAERHKMMQWWGDFLDAQQGGANVVLIRVGGGA